MFSAFKHKRAIIAVFAALFVFVQFFGLLFFTRPAKAVLGVGDTSATVVVEDIPAQRKEIKMGIGAKLLDAALGSILHAASYFMRRLAYDTAIYLATGGKGQGALIFEGDAGSYFSEIGKNAAADAIDQLGQKFGLNLCQPADLDFQVFLTIGLRSLYVDYWGGTDGPKPSCDWQSFKAATAGTYANAKGLSMERTFTNALRFEDTDFGIAAGATAKVGRNKAAAEKGAEISRMEGQGFKAVTELVTGRVKDPAQTVREESKLVTNKGQSEMTMGQVAGVYGSGSLQLIPMAASVFLNTFMSQGLKTLQEKLLTLWQEGGSGEDVAGLLSFESAGFQSNRQKAQAVFSSILTVNIQQLNNYPFLEEFAACPDPPLKPGLNNCVIDMGLRNALELARTGEPLTIAEAMSPRRGLLRGDWVLISPKRAVDNADKDCYTRAYCYSNIQKLRRQRILPLGFEIAATLADPDNPEKMWTLRQVVDGFDDCSYDEKGNVVPDFVNKPYCRLIDPNWILKAPDTRCNAKVYSSNLTDENSGMRAEECVDAPTRLREKDLPSTSEQDNFGYCTREKNVWKFGGDACEAQYNTCTTFTASEDGKMSSYLARTVDYGECNLGNVGCLAYSAEQKDGKWVTSAEAGKTMYFNDKIKKFSCSPEVNGCSEFYLGVLTEDGYVNHHLDGDLIYLKKAPDYLGCYDAKPGLASPGIDWPQTKPELKDIKSDVIKCPQFAGVCLPEEVNCDSYTSVKEPEPSLAIPAVIGEKNDCDRKCVGYDTFKQTMTDFAPSEFPLYFIPENGNVQSCSGAYEGCDEFTNIDIQTKGGKGEKLEQYTDLKYCERPNGQNESVFYSWEGSETEGYVLKTHKLRPLTDDESDYLKGLGPQLKLNDGDLIAGIFPPGSPAYASDNIEDLQTDYDSCNKDGYKKLINGYSKGFGGTASADCRALYDKNGKIFYRLLKDTITISQSCHPLRKTISYLYTDDNIGDDKELCNKKKGYLGDDPTDDKLNTDVCRRCFNGGFYENGACIYWAISQPGEAEWCPAEAVGCREYKGNAGNNLMFVWQEDFAPGEGANALIPAAKGWTADDSSQLAIVPEAIQVNGYSLQVNANEAIYVSSTLETNKLYTLSFWTRGEPQKLSVYFRQEGVDVVGDKFTYDKPHNQEINISISSDWQEFKLGPVQFVGDDTKPVELVFQRSGAIPIGAYYLDNTRILRVDDVYHLIKDSWKTPGGYNVPAVCYDGTPEGIPTDPYPGEALGCKLYKEESTGEEKPIVRFEKMCREEAVGCRAMFDTFNTDEEEMTVYNAWCEPAKDGKCTLIIADGSASKELGWCKPEPGAKGCYVDKIVLPDEKFLLNLWVKKSTVVIPADTPSDAPIYLTSRPDFQCLSINKGCHEFGAETHNLPDMAKSSFGFSDMSAMFLNDPAHYTGANGVLCRDDLVGCGEFKNENNLFYFKDPESTGNSFCEYKTKATIGDVSSFGWFKKGIGLCANDETKLCRENSDCGKGDSCGKIGAVPCYENYLLAGGEYGIWSNSTLDKYKGMVGLCPDDKNGCREFVDPADTSDLNPKGKPYYAIYNDKLTDKEKACEGQVSLKEGCVLFNKTDEPNLTFDTVATYKNSEDKDSDKYGFVPPASTEGKNNANHILKVIRERECAEWLACRGYLEVDDENALNGKRKSCYSLQLCEAGTHFSCWKEADKSQYSTNVLDYNFYVKRDTSWQTGRDFSGYSIYKQHFPTSLSFVEKDKEFYLAYKDEFSELCKTKSNGAKCRSGVCFDKECVYPPSGTYSGDLLKKDIDLTMKLFTDDLYSRECRGYPKQDSPFSDATVKDWNPFNDLPFQYHASFENVKVCKKGLDCDCDYLKVDYGDQGAGLAERHYPASAGEDVTQEICSGGAEDGKDIVILWLNNQKQTTKDSCVSGGGVIIKPVQKQSNFGWKGFCLERDLSRKVNGPANDANKNLACLTWYPMDYIPDEQDNNNLEPADKAYTPEAGAGENYCTEMLGFGGLYPDVGKLKCDLSDYDGFVGEIASAFKYDYCEEWEENAIKNFFKQDPASSEGVKQSSVVWDSFCFTEKDGGWFDGNYAVSLKCDAVKNSYGNENTPSFKTVQNLTWNLIKKLNSSFQFDFFTDDQQPFISRVDLAVNPFAGIDDMPGGGWDDSLIYTTDKTGDAELLQKQLALLYGITMSTQGKGGKPYAPLFPDVEIKHYFNLEKDKDLPISWTFSAAPSTFQFEQEPIGKVDYYLNGETGWNSGILRHAPNKAEEFLYKDMIAAVSFVPLWLSEQGGDKGVGAADAPTMGKPLTINLELERDDVEENDYKKLKGDEEPSFQNGYFVLTTKYETPDAFSNGKNTTGYLLQWWKTSPLNSTAETGFNEYGSSLRVNPLAVQTVDCSKDNESTSNHFLAVEILFEEDTGKFVGYRSRNCNQMEGTEWGYATAVVFHLKPMCVETVEVVKDVGVMSENKAWTDRVWKDSDYGKTKPTSVNYIKKDNPVFPFGSISGFSKTDTIWTSVYDEIEVDESHAGNPWLCRNKFKIADGEVTFVNSCPAETFPGAEASKKNSDNETDSKYVLTSLFAKVFEVYKRMKPSDPSVLVSGWSTDSSAKFNYELDKDTAYYLGKPPSIYPITKCVGEGEKKNCQADVNNPNAFSVNSRSGKIANEKLLGKGVYKANIEFFAWTDHNQMPIRRIMVDWREKGAAKSGTVVGKTTGYYFNYKPFCGNFECYEFPKVDLMWEDTALAGWIGKEKGLYWDRVKGEVICEDTTDCQTEFQAMISGGKYGTDADYPDLDKLACNLGKCYEIIEPATYNAAPVLVNYVGLSDDTPWVLSKVACVTSGDCQTAFNYLNQIDKYDNVKNINEPVDKDTIDCLNGFCYQRFDFSKDPVEGWIGKKQENWEGDNVLCTDDTDCHNKVNEMMNNGWGDESDYGPMSLIRCKQLDGLCYKKKVPEKAPYELDKLTGLTCESDKVFNCPDSLDNTKEQVCIDVGLRFGNQNDLSCKKEPVKRVFNYTCDANRFKPDDYKKISKTATIDSGRLSNAPYVYSVTEVGAVFFGNWDKLLLLKGYKPDDLVCVFQPKVQVLDNWGWCTGACTGVAGADGRPGCYSDGLPNKCDPTVEDAWIKYDNIIVVAP